MTNRRSIWYSKKSAARFLAVQVMYSKSFMEFHNIDEVKELLSEAKDTLDLVEIDEILLNHLVLQVMNNFHDLEKIISGYLIESWSLERINLVSLSIIKVAILELLSSELHTNIIINEYINLASYLLENSEVNFINAILDKMQYLRSEKAG